MDFDYPITFRDVSKKSQLKGRNHHSPRYINTFQTTDGIFTCNLMNYFRSQKVTVSSHDWKVQMNDTVFLIQLILFMVHDIHCKKILLIINDGLCRDCDNFRLSCFSLTFFVYSRLLQRFLQNLFIFLSQIWDHINYRQNRKFACLRILYSENLLICLIGFVPFLVRVFKGLLVIIVSKVDIFKLWFTHSLHGR